MAGSNRQLARDMKTEFEVRFQAKHARREANKALSADRQLESQIIQLLKKGDSDKALQKTNLLLHKRAIARQLDSLADMAEVSAEQVKANNTMNRMTHMMTESSRTMATAQRTMSPEKTLQALDQYRTQTDEYAVSSDIYKDALDQSTNAAVSHDAAQELLARLADQAGVELGRELSGAAAVPSGVTVAAAEPASATVDPTPEEEDALQQRLRALRA